MTEMDALAVLKADHDKVAERFEEFARASENGRSLESISDQICHELTVHAAIEETVFYPEVRDEGEEEEGEVLESLEEHHLIKTLVSELQSLTADDERFHA